MNPYHSRQKKKTKCIDIPSDLRMVASNTLVNPIMEVMRRKTSSCLFAGELK